MNPVSVLKLKWNEIKNVVLLPHRPHVACSPAAWGQRVPSWTERVHSVLSSQPILSFSFSNWTHQLLSDAQDSPLLALPQAGPQCSDHTTEWSPVQTCFRIIDYDFEVPRDTPLGPGPWSENVVQSLSHVRLFAGPTPWTAARQASLSFTISWNLLKLIFIESVMPSNHLILCHPLLLPSLFPSIRAFSSELALCISCLKYWSFSFSISPSSEFSGLISFRTDWFDLFAIQQTLGSLLQHHSSKASILQLSHPYMTTGKTTL